MTADTILVVDFGAQYARLIARRVREAHVYSEIVSPTISLAEIKARAPKGIIFSGGPKSVYESPAPSIDAGVYELGIPILGLCYGAQLMALQLGGTVSRTGQGEYGRTELTQTGASPLCPDWPATSSVWMSHGDAITEVPGRLHADRHERRRAGGGHARSQSAGSSGCSSTPRSCTPTGAARSSTISSSTCAAACRAGRTSPSSSSRWRRCGRRWGRTACCAR